MVCNAVMTIFNNISINNLPIRYHISVCGNDNANSKNILILFLEDASSNSIDLILADILELAISSSCLILVAIL